MKIIDLLNKIAKGEEVPKKIKVDGKIYEYQGDDYGHKQDDNGIIINWLFTDNEIEKYDYISEFLNDEVEIIEEDKGIEKIDVIPYEKCIHDVTHKEKEILLEIRDIQMKVNKIIDCLMENKDV